MPEKANANSEKALAQKLVGLFFLARGMMTLPRPNAVFFSLRLYSLYFILNGIK